MGRVESITVEGLDLWFNSSDHQPPHLHARKPGEWEIRIYLRTTGEALHYDLKYGRKPSTRILGLLRERVVRSRVRLLDEWERKVQT